MERAACDAKIIDARDGTPGRATEEIPPAMKRFVGRRDGGHCQTPGCRSRRALEIHHIQHREHGGDHSPSNLTLRCFRCHQSHHAGLLTIGGTAPDHLTLTRRFDVTARAPVGATNPNASPPRAPVDATSPNASPPRAPVGATQSNPPNASPPRAPVGADRELIEDARLALRTAGWSSGIANAAVAAASAACGTTELATLVRDALRCCPRPVQR